MVARDYALTKLPVALPTNGVPQFVDFKALSEHFEKVLNSLNQDAFVQDAVWRDNFIMTGTFRTFYSSQSIFAAWQQTASTRQPTSFVVEGLPQPRPKWLDLGFTFRTEGTPAASGHGYLSIVPETDGTWKIWVMKTVLEKLDSIPDVDTLAPAVPHRADSPLSNAVDAVPHVNGSTGTEVATTNGTQTSTDPDFFETIVIGGGQSGLSVGGRCKALGINYVVLEKNVDVGDSWSNRYDLTRLHTVRNFSHLPFDRTFDTSYQEFLTKDDLSRGYKTWVKKFDINVWLSTTVLSGSYNTEKKEWTLNISRNGTEKQLRTPYVVFAAGAGCQFPVTPTYENKEIYKGTAVHSGEFKNSKAFAGKHGVVVGSGNTAHDMAEDMLANGLASVTMIQRNATAVVPFEHYRVTHDSLYNEQIPIEVADRLFFTGPSVLGRLMGNQMLHGKARADPERFDALEKAGFKLDREPELHWYLFERFGGHYMDVGTSAKISKGLIKMQTSLPTKYTENGLEFADGTQIPADLIVFATGFVGNLRTLVSSLFGPEVANQLDDYWGMDDEGELKGAFKQSGHPALWSVGGAIGQARYMSRWPALQIKLKLLGTEIPVYRETPPRHNSDKFCKCGLIKL